MTRAHSAGHAFLAERRPELLKTCDVLDAVFHHKIILCIFLVVIVVAPLSADLCVAPHIAVMMGNGFRKANIAKCLLRAFRTTIR